MVLRRRRSRSSSHSGHSNALRHAKPQSGRAQRKLAETSPPQRNKRVVRRVRASEDLMQFSQGPLRSMLAGAIFMFAPLAALGAALPSAATAPPVAIPAPGTLHYTTNVSTCAGHGGTTSACQALAKQGTVAVYGSWDCTGCSPISGYRLKVPGLDGVVRDGKTIFWI